MRNGRTYCRRACLSVLAALTMWGAPPAFAAEGGAAQAAAVEGTDARGTGAEGASAVEATTDGQRDDTKRTKTAETEPAQEKTAPGDVFLPTERISEDYAVAFPTDI